MKRIYLTLAITISGTAAALTGCGGAGDRPELGMVTGVVTIDGDPLPNAVVMFKPEGKRSSRGFTDSQGRYELIYLRDIRGATTGSHRVIIDRVPQKESGKYQRLPDCYNIETELTAEVEPGENLFDWELFSN